MFSSVSAAYCRTMRRALPRFRFSMFTPVVVDRLIVAGLIIGGLVQAWPSYLPSPAMLYQLDWASYAGPLVFAIIVPLPLLMRRTHSLIAFAASILALAATSILSLEVSSPAFMIFLAAYSVGRYTAVRELSIAALIAAIGIGLAATLTSEGPNTWFAFMIAILVGLWLTGDTARARELRAEQLEERAARHEAEQRSAAARAADEERSRIARELHDVIAHNVSVIVVQAAAARRVIDHDPAQAKASLATIETTGREALSEMRRLLGVLRADEAGLSADMAPSGPQPSLGTLSELVEEMRAAGLPVELAVEGTPRELPPGVDLSAYRVVQEALTNSLRHGDGAATRVVVRYECDSVDLEIVDQGRGVVPVAGGESATAGHGLAGMRERVALVRGELEAGPRPEGGFRVRARLPVDAT